MLLCRQIEGIDRPMLHAAYSTCLQESPASLTSRSQDTLPAMAPSIRYSLVAQYREVCRVVVHHIL